MEDRSFFLVTDTGEEIGTITAWWNADWKGQEWGQIHWLAMKRLKQLHDRCFLGSSTARIAAIKVYLDFGFYPDLDDDGSQEAWTHIAAVLPRPIFKACGF